MEVCTIIAKNYVAHARVLARSLARHQAGSRLWVLIIDDFAGYLEPAGEPFEVLTPSDIGCDPFIPMAMRYSVLELSTAVKPWLLRHLVRRNGCPITYLDPDIRIYGPMQRLDDEAARHGVVLIPHNSKPIPADGRKPSQVDIMIAGVYNLGYVSVAPRAELDTLLDWWGDRLLRDCRVDPVWGYFVDQRWFDLVPGFLREFSILRDPEYNVAYWNLHDRELRHDGVQYTVDGHPLAFFHFSGFDPEHPLILSRHQNRIDVVGQPVLERLLADYAAEVLAEGHAVSRHWSYTYDAMGDGRRLDDTLRRLYDDFEREEGAGLSPFTLEGAHAFGAWMTAQAPDAPRGVNRVLARVYQDRSDLRGAYPNLDGNDREGLLRWAREHGPRDLPELAQLMTAASGNGGGGGARAATTESSVPRPSASASASQASGSPPSTRVAPGEGPPPLSQAPYGVNVVGYFRSEVGTGEAARQVVSALDAANIPVLPIHGQSIPVSRQGHAYATSSPEDAAYPVNLICMNADMLPEFALQAGDQFFAGRYSIGLWFWEVSRFPERWRGAFSLLEEVWAPTAHIAAALEPVAPVPVNTVRIPIAPPTAKPLPRADLGLPDDGFLFLFSFDYLSVFRRKNPVAVVDAFSRAFAAGNGAGLVLKCINHDRDPQAHAELLAAAAAHPDIVVIDRYMSPEHNSALTATCDCYVSLHRAEGLGLVMAEAMALAKPVIATGYSGNMDFMTPANSLLVQSRLVPIGPGAEPYPAEGEWAEPDVDHAASLMRELVENPTRARELGALAAADIRRTHSPRAAGEIMYRRLESIRATGRARAIGGVRASSTRGALAALPLKVRQGPARGAQGSPRRLRELARNVVLRGIRPFTQYQQSVNTQIVEALQELSAELDEARREDAGERARLLAELRRRQDI